MKALFFDFDGMLIEINRREIEVIYDTVNHFGLGASKPRVKQLCIQMPSYTDVFKKLGLELTETAIDYWTSVFVESYSARAKRAL